MGASKKTLNSNFHNGLQIQPSSIFFKSSSSPPIMLLLLSHSSPLTQIPKSILSISISLSQFSTLNHSPSRKPRQSAQRIITLLSPKSNQNPNLHESLKTLKHSPQTLTSSQASLLITTISNPLISFDFYRFLKSFKNPVFQLDSNVYFTLIRSQVESINPKLFKIEFYFNEMKKRNVCLLGDDFVSFVDLVVPEFGEIAEFFVREVLERDDYDESSYSYLIRAYAKCGLCKEAIGIAERGKVKFEKRKLEFYASVMSVYRVSGDTGAAMELFLEMEDRGVVGDEDFYRVLLGILCRGGSVKLCKVVLEEMRQIGYGVDECLVVKLMEMFIREDMLSEAGYLVEEGNIKSTKSLSTFVEVIAEKKGPLEVFEIVKKMQESGLNVGGQVYASLIHECGKIGLIEDAEKMFKENKAMEGDENRKAVYSSMISVYSKREMRTKAEMVFNKMEALTGFKGSEEVFSYMISMYGVLGLFDNVESMFNFWKSSATGINVDVYITMINALSMWGKLDRARGFLLEMRNCGFQPNSSIYSSMLEGYLRLGLVNHASALFDEYKLLKLEVDDLNPIAVLNLLIQADRFTELGVYLDKIMRDGVKISRDQGLPLLELCRNASCLEKLGKLLQ